MDNNYFESAAKALQKTQNRVEVHKILVAIRKELDGKHVTDRIKFLVTSGCVKHLILCLRQENTAIIDLTLSILGNCCIDYTFAKDLIKYNFLHSLETLLLKCQKDSVQGRSFRIIANICDHTCSHMMMLKQPKLVSKIVFCLAKVSKDETDGNNTETSEATIVSGLRALRKLVKHSTLSLLIEKYNVLKVVGGLLIKYTEIWKKDQDCKHIIDEILRVLLLYSRFSHSETVYGLKLTDRGDALNCLSDILHVSLTRIVKIIINLSNVAVLKCDLPVKAICQTLLNDITAVECPVNERANYLTALNELMTVPSYREYMSSEGNVKQLIALLRRLDENSMKCTTLVLYILLKCHGDQLSTSSMIVSVLIDKLAWFGKPSTEILRPRDCDQVSGKRKRFKSFHIGDPMSQLTRDRYREDRCSSPSELSDISSNGPYSPSCSSVREDICDSDNYSPVCSDAEEPDVVSVHSEPRSHYSSEDDLTVLSDVQDKLFSVIMALLTRYTKLKPATPSLADPRLLILLVNYWIDSIFDCSSAEPVIFSIIRNKELLIPILQTNFVFLVYNRITKTKDYRAANSKLSDVVAVFTSLAESEMGKGDIAHTLLRGADLKIKVAASIPFVVKNKSLMAKFMVNCGGLKLLLNSMNTDNLKKQILKGLHILASEHLKIKNPITDGTSGLRLAVAWTPIEPNEYQYPEHCENVVIFKFEGADEVVPADRDFLTSKGCYFSTLLSGSFKESNENEILLKKVRCESFKCLLIFLRDFGTKHVVCMNLDIMLELLELTDRYLLPDLHVYLSDCVQHFLMTDTSVPIIYRWSIDSKTNILRVESIAFSLVTRMHDERRRCMFESLMEYEDSVIQDIGTLLLRFFKK